MCEFKRVFSVVLLRFDNGSREAYHDHAFDCFSWVLRGELNEQFLAGPRRVHRASVKPFVTRRRDFHKVSSNGTTWVLSFRGPWLKRWHERTPGGFVELTSGREVVRAY